MNFLRMMLRLDLLTPTFLLLQNSDNRKGTIINFVHFLCFIALIASFVVTEPVNFLSNAIPYISTLKEPILMKIRLNFHIEI